jgi:LPXTG-motif cell wall-anchored protein
VNRTSLKRRLFTGAAGLLVGSAAALSLVTPAAATQDGPDGPEIQTYTTNKIELTGAAECDPEARTWTVSWTVTNNFHLVEQATVSAVSSEVDGFEVGTVVPAGESVSGTQTIPSGTASAELTVELRWAWEWRGHWFEKKKDATAVVELADCGEPEPEPEDPQTGEILFEFDCEVFTLTITNTTDVEELLTVVPSEGEPVEVTVPAGTEEEPGESEPVSFPSSEGLVVDVQFEGESVIDGGPIEITSEEWAELGCDEGEGGELPITGSSTMLIAGGAVALLALGGGLFLVARRRRVTFTA